MKIGCPTCKLLCRAILEFSKPLLRIDLDFLETLESSSITSLLRIRYTTMVQVWGEDELVEEPYFEQASKL